MSKAKQQQYYYLLTASLFRKTGLVKIGAILSGK
jgi:hypothetical protein